MTPTQPTNSTLRLGWEALARRWLSPSPQTLSRKWCQGQFLPHFHVEYQGHEVLVAIKDGSIVQGSLPRRAHAIVRQWCVDHQAELEQNWAKAQALQPLSRIPGADND